jgi:glycosyltransferase involved in cell wall biosynthesis
VKYETTKKTIMKKITILTPCYNEEQNVEILYDKVKSVFAQLVQYSYEHIFIDNDSTDKTLGILKNLAYPFSASWNKRITWGCGNFDARRFARFPGNMSIN